MSQVRMLDCTLRDGGYVNDWKFGRETLCNVFERLISSGVEAIEVGFLDERRAFDPDRSILPDTASVRKIYGKIDKKDAIVVGMIDYGTCKIERLEPCAESYLDGIRVIFKKHIMREAIAFCKQVKQLGYRVFVQAVSITSYTDEDLLALIGLVNELEPFAISMVDTYGLLHQSGLMHVFDILDAHLLPGISLGYHAHNNFQMGYANCIEVLNRASKRPLLVDATLYGMGKSAGNTPSELLAMYMNENCGKRYDVSQMLEAIETGVMDVYRETPWGYNLFYYISASNKCHPNYVSYLMNKKTLSVRSIGEILAKIEPEKKLLYDQKHIETLYLDFQKNALDDAAAVSALTEKLSGRRVLVLGPGKRLWEQEAAVHAYIEREKPLVMAINYVPKSFSLDSLFITNAKRYLQMSTELLDNADLPLIATSNVTQTARRFDYVLDYATLIDERTEIPDNSLVMLLRLFGRVGVAGVSLAGFDGYSPSETNYMLSGMEYSFAKEKAAYLNGYVRAFLRQNRETLSVTFVTDSVYNSEE